MRVLVTGGAGFIGSNLVEELVKEHEVIVLDNFHTGSMDNLRGLANDIEIIEDSCNNLLNRNIKVDAIYHLGIPSSNLMYKENPLLVGEAINGSINVLEVARRDGIKAVFASTSSLYNRLEPPHREDMQIKVTDYYMETRLCIERLAKLYNILYGVQCIGLRLFSIYGPKEEAKGKYANVLSQFMWDIKAGRRPIVYGDGSQTRDFTFVKDAVRAFILAMESNIDYGIFNVGTGVSYTFNEIIEILNRKLKKDVKPTYVKNPIKNYVMHTLADTTKARERLGFEAQYPLEEGIDQII